MKNEKRDKQYEELCRYFLADRLKVGVEKIQSIHIPNPKRPNLPEFKHQIDLYWETGDDVSLYLNIANAKWRSSDKVDQPEILLLQQVKHEVGAHKAVMLTNTGFTAGARAAAQHNGIALHIVRPAFDFALLPQKNLRAIQAKIQELVANSSRPIYEHQEVYKAFNLTDIRSPTLTSLREEHPYISKPAKSPSTKIVTGPTTRGTGGYSHKGGGLGSGGRGGPPGQRSSSTTKTGGRGFRKK